MRIGKERCERKAYPHRVYPDRNRIRLRVTGAFVCFFTMYTMIDCVYAIYYKYLMSYQQQIRFGLM